MKRFLSEKTGLWFFGIAILMVLLMLVWVLATQEDASTKMFDWLRDVAVIISALATLSLAIIAFRSIIENRRQRQKAMQPSLQINDIRVTREHLNVIDYGPTLRPSVSLAIANIGSGPMRNLAIYATSIFEVLHETPQAMSYHQVNFKLRRSARDLYLEHTSEPTMFTLEPTHGSFPNLQAERGLLAIRLEFLDIDGLPFMETRSFPLSQSDTRWEVSEEDILLPFHENYPTHLLAP